MKPIGRRWCRGGPDGLLGDHGGVPAPASGPDGAASQPAEEAQRLRHGHPEQPGLDGCGAGRGFGDGQRHAPATGDRRAAQLHHQGAEGGGPLRILKSEEMAASVAWSSGLHPGWTDVFTKTVLYSFLYNV